jgi:hypothetical protein
MAKAPVVAGPSAPRRARTRRIYSTVLWWVFVGLFIYNAAVIGQAFFWVPAVAFGLGAVLTTRLALSPRAPEKFAPEPGALAAARKGAVVECPATLVTRAGTRPGPAQAGELRVTERRLTFVTDAGEVLVDAPVKQLRLASVPGFMRPQLDLDVGGTVHTVRFFPMWDLGATFVGPTVAGEWYRQLRALGAS